MSTSQTNVHAPVAFVALGSNLGHPRENVARAVERLRGLSAEPLKVSSFWRTTPVGCRPGSPDFINAVVRLVPLSGETPDSLLRKLQHIELEFGRRRSGVPNEDRPLDLDIIAFGAISRSSPELTLPHPRAHQRRFVLAPLAEIVPDLILPGQERSVSDLLGALATSEEVCVRETHR